MEAWLTGIDSPAGSNLSTHSAVTESLSKRLSRREHEVLHLITHGKTNREIAEALFISKITVSNHVTHILDKLGVPNRTAAAIFAATNDVSMEPARV